MILFSRRFIKIIVTQKDGNRQVFMGAKFRIRRERLEIDGKYEYMVWKMDDVLGFTCERYK